MRISDLNTYSNARCSKEEQPGPVTIGLRAAFWLDFGPAGLNMTRTPPDTFTLFKNKDATSVVIGENAPEVFTGRCHPTVPITTPIGAKKFEGFVP